MVNVLTNSPLEYVVQGYKLGHHDMGALLVTREDLKTDTRLSHMDSSLEYAVLQYPMLRPEYIKEKRDKTHYPKKMFEAVVAAEQYKHLSKSK